MQDKSQSGSPKTKEEATKIAQGIKKPEQTKAQTRLIAQGIQKGIDLYKKQQNTKAREFDKKRKQALKEKGHEKSETIESPETNPVKQHWLPWIMLLLTWTGIAVYFTLLKN